MDHRTLDYRSPAVPRPPRPGRVVAASVGVVVVVALLNIGLFWFVGLDDWGPAIIGFLVGPIANGLAAVTFLACIPAVRQFSARAPVWHYALAAYLVPGVAIFIDVLICFGVP